MNQNLAPKYSRRKILAGAGLAFLTTAGCDKLSDSAAQVDEAVREQVESTSTQTLQITKVALKGYELVSFAVAKRVISLPVPGVRIIAATLVVTAVGAHLAVDYIDEELIVRKYKEKLSPEEQTVVETKGQISFQTASGNEETVYLAPTEYAD